MQSSVALHPTHQYLNTLVVIISRLINLLLLQPPQDLFHRRYHSIKIHTNSHVDKCVIIKDTGRVESYRVTLCKSTLDWNSESNRFRSISRGTLNTEGVASVTSISVRTSRKAASNNVIIGSANGVVRLIMGLNAEPALMCNQSPLVSIIYHTWSPKPHLLNKKGRFTATQMLLPVTERMP